MSSTSLSSVPDDDSDITLSDTEELIVDDIIDENEEMIINGNQIIEPNSNFSYVYTYSYETSNNLNKNYSYIPVLFIQNINYNPPESNLNIV